MLIGTHVGVAEGWTRAVDYADSVGCECMQVFVKSPRQWQARPMDPGIAQAFRARLAHVGMGPVLAHSAYLINLGTADDELWERSWRAVADELRRTAEVGAVALVTHVGTAYVPDPVHTPLRIAAGIDRAWELADVRGVRLLMENTAAAGSTFGDGPDELAAVLDRLDSAAGSVGICLDTCHAHAAGWDLAIPSTWSNLVDVFEYCCGMPIEAVHANDCAFPPGLHRDRHAWIGDGTIGYEGFAAMMAEPRLHGLPVITEMPGDPPYKDVENIRRLKSLRDASAARG